uniref:Uncharacterized protein n=1 Tax=Salix viminalis TaxID=40686 RepID=A0A6N2M9D9_SALVM
MKLNPPYGTVIQSEDALLLMKAKMNNSCDLLDEIIAHTKENAVKKKGLTCDEMEAEREEDTSFEKLDKKHFVKGFIIKLVYVFLFEASSLTYAVIAPGFHALYLEATVKKGKAIVGDLPPVMGKLKAFIFNKEETSGILNELYADLSNEIEFENFLKEATYSFYCMELGVIRDLQCQATAKSGASKQSSSFLKATTMTLFTISESEKASYVHQIYSYLGDDPFLKQFLPIDPDTKDLFNLVKDGVLLCTKRVLNPWEEMRIIPYASTLQKPLDYKASSVAWLDFSDYKVILRIFASSVAWLDFSDYKGQMNKLCDLLDEVSFGANVPCFSSILLISITIIAHTKENVVKKQLASKSSQVASVLETSSWTAGNKDIQG